MKLDKVFQVLKTSDTPLREEKFFWKEQNKYINFTPLTKVQYSLYTCIFDVIDQLKKKYPDMVSGINSIFTINDKEDAYGQYLREINKFLMDYNSGKKFEQLFTHPINFVGQSKYINFDLNALIKLGLSDEMVKFISNMIEKNKTAKISGASFQEFVKLTNNGYARFGDEVDLALDKIKCRTLNLKDFSSNATRDDHTC